MTINKTVPVNFEFFPPKTEAGQAKLIAPAVPCCS